MHFTREMSVDCWRFFGLNNILFNKSQDMLWKYIVEIESDIKLWGLLWSFPGVFLTVRFNYMYIDLYMIFWFCFTFIKISPRQTISSRSLASTTWHALMTSCSYDLIMRKWQVLNLTLRVPPFNLGPKQFALCQMCSNI